MIGMKVNVDDALKQVQTLQEDQLPFIIAKSLTKVAQEAQKATRFKVNQVFDNRNDWTVRGVKITPATKTRLLAEVFTDTENRKTHAPDYLERQEDGQERVPFGGRKYMAIPTKYLYQIIGGKGKIIPDALRPNNLKEIAVRKGGYVNRYGNAVKSSPRTQGYYFFLVTFRSGTMGIMARAAADDRSAAVPLYVLVREAHIRKRLGMQEVVEQTVNAEFAAIFQQVASEVGISIGL